MGTVAGKKIETTDIVAVGGAVALVGLGLWFYYKKPAAIRVGDKVIMNKFSIEYFGGTITVFANWGFRAGFGDFNNGANLLGGVLASAGPIELPFSSPKALYQYETAKQTWNSKPVIYLDPSWAKPGDWQTYTWITRDKATAEESYIIGGSLEIGPKVKIAE